MSSVIGERQFASVHVVCTLKFIRIWRVGMVVTWSVCEIRV